MRLGRKLCTVYHAHTLRSANQVRWFQKYDWKQIHFISVWLELAPCRITEHKIYEKMKRRKVKQRWCLYSVWWWNMHIRNILNGLLVTCSYLLFFQSFHLPFTPYKFSSPISSWKILTLTPAISPRAKFSLFSHLKCILPYCSACALRRMHNIIQ